MDCLNGKELALYRLQSAEERMLADNGDGSACRIIFTYDM
ncbi:hypothetical protein P378_20590 [Desulforamulus profundi]|uniref:Uncharacterized protein n=1 Tax=Desulforamulus profundi TaxID=1383067 RepID=A0A2C6M6T0_9FIRM|nr:hypothetical protein P378_20590 [Desulforamulus profundi]